MSKEMKKKGVPARALAVPISLLWLGALASPAASQVPQWDTWANHLGDPLYVQKPYNVVFVAAKIVEGTTTTQCPTPQPLGLYAIGTDVLEATNPSPGNSLWVVTRNGDVKKLFPLPVHGTTQVTNPETGLQVPLIDTPAGLLDNGSVVEPNVSEDGTRVIFAYFHDATPGASIPSNQGGMSKRGADLYVMDMTALLADPTVNPALLPVKRLTFKVYDATGAQADADKNKNAMNQAVVNNGNNGWGTVFMHGTEMRTSDGLKLVYVSGEKRLMNSNDQRGWPNYNLNLNIADIKADGSLGAKRQWQYYTTTSALSPTPLPEGVAITYQATTGDGRNWQIQRIDSVGRWKPLIGYGSNPDLFHLGAYCVDSVGDSHGNQPGDYFVAVRYYNQNNNGFGSLWKINLAETGINIYDVVVANVGVKPRQKNARRLSLNVPDGDDPSGKDGNGQFFGKITTPRCGGPDELFFAYTPTSANSRLCASDGKGIYHSYIAYRSGFEDFNPIGGSQILVDDGNDAYSLVWPVPLLSWQARTGNAQQAFTDSVIDPSARIVPGQPYAIVGTSAIYNTDRRPYDCWLGPGLSGHPYDPNQQDANSPNGLNNNQRDQITGNFDAVTKVMQTGGNPDFCKPLTKADVLGIQVNITNNKINHLCCSLGYETDVSGKNETVKELGVYDVRSQTDGSFKALIPSHVPFELHLLDVKYGMRLVDVRTWHSLQPRESRTNCGGCHQHVEGLGIPFAGTVAAGQRALDMVTQTQTVTYDGLCNPALVTTPNATERLPEWKQDVWPGLNTHCSSCHTGTGAGTTVFSYTDEQTAYNALASGNYANSISGALGSPAFWAARGERTDGRNNALYATTSPPYKFSAVHATTPGLCAQNDPVKAEWVRKLGQWIDNHMPRNTSGNFPVDKDTYHPTVDGAVYDPTCAGTKLRVGFWDDSGSVQSVEVFKNGVSIGGPWGPLPNGTQTLTGLTIANADVIKVVAEDADHNRQWYEKTGKQLKNECQVTIQPLPVQPVP